jgi:hypothetical protein
MTVGAFTIVVSVGESVPTVGRGAVPIIGAIEPVTNGAVNVLVVIVGASLVEMAGAGSTSVVVRAPLRVPKLLVLTGETTGENKVGDTELTSTGATFMVPTKLT